MSALTDRLSEADLRELARLVRVIHERSEARRNSRDGPVRQDRLAQTPAAAKRRESESRLALGSGGDGGAP
jgi:hypothetical protein